MTTGRTAEQDLLAIALQWREAGQRAAIATVVSTWGSAPRPAGSLLVCNAAGQFAGSVSGGCVEVAVIEAAAQEGRRSKRIALVNDCAGLEVEKDGLTYIAESVEAEPIVKGSECKGRGS